MQIKYLSEKEIKEIKKAAKNLVESIKQFSKIIHESGMDKEFMEMVEMKIKIPIGTRATCLEFCDTYQSSYLSKYGWSFHRLDGQRFMQYLRSVKTKYGEIIVNYDDVLTYAGDGIWDVRSKEKDKHHEN